MKFRFQSLEQMFLNKGFDKETGFTVHEIIVPILGGIYKPKKYEIKIDTYDKFLRRFIRNKCLPINVDLGDDFDIFIDFVDLPIRNQVLILHSLCYFLIESEITINPKFLSIDTDRFRAEPIGQDSRKNSYWYFRDRRLYKEQLVSDDESVWSVECFTEDDWWKLSEKLGKSKNVKDKALNEKLLEIIVNIQKLEKDKLKAEKINNRYTISGFGSEISTRTRSRRCNSIDN